MSLLDFAPWSYETPEQKQEREQRKFRAAVEPVWSSFVQQEQDQEVGRFRDLIQPTIQAAQQEDEVQKFRTMFDQQFQPSVSPQGMFNDQFDEVNKFREMAKETKLQAAFPGVYDSLSDDERQRLLGSPPDEIDRVIAEGNLGAITDIGAPRGEPSFPGIVGKIPGFRNPAELASTVGTAGMGIPGSLSARALKAGVMTAGGSLGALVGGKAAEEVGAPEWTGELAGGLVGGGVGLTAGARVARGLEEQGGVAGLARRALSEERGGSQFVPPSQRGFSAEELEASARRQLEWVKANPDDPTLSEYGSRYARIMQPEIEAADLASMPYFTPGDSRNVSRWLTEKGQAVFADDIAGAVPASRVLDEPAQFNRGALPPPRGPGGPRVLQNVSDAKTGEPFTAQLYRGESGDAAQEGLIRESTGLHMTPNREAANAYAEAGQSAGAGRVRFGEESFSNPVVFTDRRAAGEALLADQIAAGEMFYGTGIDEAVAKAARAQGHDAIVYTKPDTFETLGYPGPKEVVIDLRGGTGGAPPPPRGPDAPSGGMEPPFQPPEPPLSKLTSAIKAAGKATPEQRAMFAQQRAQRTGSAAGALESGVRQGDVREGFDRAKAALSGEFERPQFMSPEFSEEDMAQLLTDIATADAQFYAKLSAQTALEDLARGRIPEPARLEALKQVFPQGGDDLIKAIQSKRGLGEKLLNEVLSIPGLSMALKASFDMGTRFRQGMVLGWSHPRQWLSNWKPTANALFSEDAAQGVARKIETNPWFSIEAGEKAGLGFKDLGGHLYSWSSFTPGSERVEGFTGFNDSFLSRAVQRIPGLRGSERAFATDLNKQGMDVYAYEAQRMWDAGVRDPDMYKAVASVINHARGYGAFNPGQIAKGVNAFFSGRNLVAKFQVALDPIVQPGSLLSPSARQLAAKNLVGMVAGDMTVLGFLGGMGVLTGIGSVQFNPKNLNADWLKFKVGNTRIDPWGGFLPMARLIARMGAATLTETGIKKTSYDIGTTKRALGSFFENKEAPMVRLFTDVMGISESFEPRELSPKLLADLYAPFIAQDVWEAVKQEDWGMAAAAPPISGVGVGIQSYEESALSRLRQIPEYGELNPDHVRQLRDFIGQVDEARLAQTAKYGQADNWTAAAGKVAQSQGQSQGFLGWAIALHGNKVQRNPAYTQFLVEHEGELRERYPWLYDSMDVARAISETKR